MVPRQSMDECQRLGQTLRSENARLKDRLLALQGQSRDYAERAVDDSRRLATQDEAIERLEQSVAAYQDERNRLEAAYRQLASSLGTAPLPPGERVGLNDPEARRQPVADSSQRRARPSRPGAADDQRRQ
jgi:hypothetical protein